MKHDLQRTFLYGLIAGVILYLLGICTANLMYFDLSEALFRVLMIIAFFAGAIVTGASLIIHQPCFLNMLMRTLILHCSIIFSFLLDAMIGVTRHMHKVLFHVPLEDNVWGLVLLIFWITIVIACIATLVISMLFRSFKKHFIKA